MANLTDAYIPPHDLERKRRIEELMRTGNVQAEQILGMRPTAENPYGVAQVDPYQRMWEQEGRRVDTVRHENRHHVDPLSYDDIRQMQAQMVSSTDRSKYIEKPTSLQLREMIENVSSELYDKLRADADEKEEGIVITMLHILDAWFKATETKDNDILTTMNIELAKVNTKKDYIIEVEEDNEIPF